MFEFNADSIIVQSWVSLVRDGKKTQQQVPNLYNLRELVFAEIDKIGRE